jgi:hypothetical protein
MENSILECVCSPLSRSPYRIGNRKKGLFDLFTPETAGAEITEQNFICRLKKKQKRQRRM